MKKISKEELQKLFGPKVLELAERPSHIGMRPVLILEKETTDVEKLEIGKKFNEWTHQLFLKSLGLKNDEEYHKWIYKNIKNESI